jgi:hypothetical protein
MTDADLVAVVQQWQQTDIGVYRLCESAMILYCVVWFAEPPTDMIARITTSAAVMAEAKARLTHAEAAANELRKAVTALMTQVRIF